jgi:3-phosphoshikimate 1-carboxyvinyltransferase
MGMEIIVEGEHVSVSGRGGVFSPFTGRKKISLGNSGTSYRLLLSVAALGQGEYIFTGSSRMRSRPVRDLVRALKDLGVEAVCTEKEGYPPVSIKAHGIRGGGVKIPGNISSQYISSLLISGPYARDDMEIEITGSMVSRPYLDLTMGVMSAFGIEVEHHGYRHFNVTAGKRYQPRGYVIEGDVSSASYFWGAAAVTGGTVITENIDPYDNMQGDIAFLDILEEMGCHVQREPGKVIVQGGKLVGVEVDMGSMPDMAPTLAAIGLFAGGETIIRNVPHLRHKESDRISDTVLELRKVGGHIEELKDGIIIHGGEKVSGADVDPHNDHRLAMSFAIVGLKVPGIRIKDEHCVVKSFPSFWDLWDTL